MDLYVQYVTAKLQLSQNRRIIHFIKKLAGFLFVHNDIMSITHITNNWKKEKRHLLLNVCNHVTVFKITARICWV